MDSVDLELVKKYKAHLTKFGIPVEKVYAFGSRVRGDYRESSDLDVCVVSSIFGVDRQGARVLLMSLADGVFSIIEPHPMSQKELADKFNPLSTEIRAYGVEA